MRKVLIAIVVSTIGSAILIMVIAVTGFLFPIVVVLPVLIFFSPFYLLKLIKQGLAGNPVVINIPDELIRL